MAMKLFISQPMRGLTDEEILAVRQKAKADVEKIMGEEVEVLESFFQNAPAVAKPLWYLGESIKLLGEADLVYFAEGWENNRGCRIEHLCTVEYGKDLIEPDPPVEPDPPAEPEPSNKVNFTAEEVHHNCTVVVLHDQQKGLRSIGWWPEEQPPMTVRAEEV